MRAPWFGLQKNARDWRCGVTASVSLIWRAGGATTRCSVERRTSLLQRASRSPAFTTMVPGWETCERKRDRVRRGDVRWAWLVGIASCAGSRPRVRQPVRSRVLAGSVVRRGCSAHRILEEKRQGAIVCLGEFSLPFSALQRPWWDGVPECAPARACPSFSSKFLLIGG